MRQNQQSISDLITKFNRNIEEYKNPKFNEAQVRIEFVNPFWKALGWDVDNDKGYSFAYRDVIHEDEVKIGRTTKAPDYSFRIGGSRVFFVETKKPSIDLKHDPAPAFQLRRYAYSAKLPISILTDFEEFIIYDCRMKPALSDKPHVGRILYYTFEEYLDKWDEISGMLSKEAIQQGELDRYIKSKEGKKPKAEIDRDFLNDLDNWRIQLARNIALRNTQLNERELNYAVQLTIDRLIFLRMSEDRGIETQFTLQALLGGENVYRRLVQIYYKADERYNSGLFHFEEKDGPNPDTITPELALDDKTLKEIIGALYYPKCPYEFSVLPVEVLGNAYEQFLGKRISLTKGHYARIEEKPEVRKAGGVYYTPKYIVDYIVKNTVGKLCENKTPKEISEICILDPACGSGSFLLGAFHYLLEWHLDFYRKEYEKTGQIPTTPLPKGKRKRKSDPQVIFQGAGENWYLGTTEKKRILTNNIYGVDIDANAVEVTKLSLLLKVLENENSETLNQQLGLWHERALPNLENNIKCGNSLIGPDFYDNQQSALFDEEEMYRINVFDWQSEFKEVFGKGGFDAVIGNPPYVRQEMLGEYKEYFQQKYKVYHGVADLYSYFIERGIELLKEKGYFSYIVSNKWLRANYGKSLRKWLKKQCIFDLLDFGDLPVFKGVTTYPCILIVKNQKPENKFKATLIKSLEFKELTKYASDKGFFVNQSRLNDEGWALVNEAEQKLLDKIKSNGIPLGEYVSGKIYRGIITGLNEAFVISKVERDELIVKDPKSAEIIKPFLLGRDVKRYAVIQTDNYLIFTRHGININNYPTVKEYLMKFKTRLMPKPKGFKGEWKGRKPGKYEWYEIQDTIDYYLEFENEKLIYPNICKKAEFTIDSERLVTNQKCFIIRNGNKYLLGILNSKITNFLFEMILPKLRGGFFEPGYVYLKNFPIYKIDTKNKSELNIKNEIEKFVNKILELNKKLSQTKDPQSQKQLQRQIEATDKQIDKLVYQLYDLTEEEIRIVEEAVG